MANKTKVVHVAIEPEHYKALVKLAAEWACPISQIIRSAIRSLLSDERKARA